MNLEHIAAFWSRFALEQFEVDGAQVLENRNLPFLEVNAGFPTSSDQIPALEVWFAARGRPGVLIVPEHSDLEIAVNNAGFEPFGSFSVLEWEPGLTPGWSALPFQIEQVSWSIARECAQIWGTQQGALKWVESISGEIARIMQLEPKLMAFLAYQNDRAIGMALVLDGEMYLHSADLEVTRAFVKRAAFDLENAVRLYVPVEQIFRWPLLRELEQFSIWVKT